MEIKIIFRTLFSLIYILGSLSYLPTSSLSASNSFLAPRSYMVLPGSGDLVIHEGLEIKLQEEEKSFSITSDEKGLIIEESPTIDRTSGKKKLREVLGSQDPDSKSHGVFTLSGLKVNNSGNLHFNFRPSGAPRLIRAKFHTGMVGEVEVSRIRLSHPGNPSKGYYLYRLKGQDEHGLEQILYYDLKRDSKGKPDFTKTMFSFENLTIQSKRLYTPTEAFGRYWLRRVLESEDPDSKSHGVFALSGLKVDNRGYLSFKICPWNKAKSIQAKFYTGMVGEVEVSRIKLAHPGNPSKGYYLYRLKGRDKDGKEQTCFYDLNRDSKGKPDFTKTSFSFENLTNRAGGFVYTPTEVFGRYWLRRLLESEDPDSESHGVFALSGLKVDNGGYLSFKICPWNKAQSIQTKFASTGMVGEVEVSRIKLAHPGPSKGYYLYRLKGRDEDGKEQTRFYDLNRDSKGKPDFTKTTYSFENLTRRRKAIFTPTEVFGRYWLRRVLESEDPNSESHGVFTLQGLRGDKSTYLRFYFYPWGSTQPKEIVFAIEGMVGEIEVSRIKIVHPGNSNIGFYLYRLKGQDRDGKEQILYYDLRRDGKGKPDFSKNKLSFENLTSRGPTIFTPSEALGRYWLMRVLESEDPDSESHGVFTLSELKVDNNGNLNLRFRPWGEENRVQTRISETRMIGEVEIVSEYSPQLECRLFRLYGEDAQGNRWECTYRLKPFPQTWEGVNNYFFLLLERRWLGHRDWDPILHRIESLLAAVAERYGLSDIQELIQQHPRLLRRLLFLEAQRAEVNSHELEAMFWRYFLNQSFFGPSFFLGERDSGSFSPAREEEAVSPALIGELEALFTEDEELAYAEYRREYFIEGRSVEDILGALRGTEAKTEPQSRARARLVEELTRLSVLQTRIQRAGILKTGFTLDVYQLEGIQKILDRGSLIVGDEVGLGKTIQVLVATLLSGAKKIVIVSPKSGFGVYLRELATRVALPVKVDLLTGERQLDVSPYQNQGLNVARRTPQNKARFLTTWFGIEEEERSEIEILLTNYEQLVGQEEVLSEVNPVDVKIIDEAQQVKHEERDRTQAVLAIPSKRTLLMSATIVDNLPVDLRLPLKQLWDNLSDDELDLPQWQYLCNISQYLENDEAFTQLLTPSLEPTEESRRQSYLNELQEVLKEGMLRRRAEEVISRKLPKKEEVEVSLDIEKGVMIFDNEEVALGEASDYAAQRAFYQRIATDLEIPAVARKSYLRQLLSDPKLLVRSRPEGEEEPKYLSRVREHIGAVEEEFDLEIKDWRSIKQDAVEEIRKRADANDHRFTLFTRSIVVVERLQNGGMRGIASTIDGTSLPLEDRESRVEAFQREEFSELALSYGVGGVALDLSLHRAPKKEVEDWVIMESLPDKGSVLRQAIGRHMRRSRDNRDRREKETVRVFKLITTKVGRGIVSVDERDHLICQYKDLLAHVLENGALVWSVIEEMKGLEGRLDRGMLLVEEEEDSRMTPDLGAAVTAIAI